MLFNKYCCFFYELEYILCIAISIEFNVVLNDFNFDAMNFRLLGFQKHFVDFYNLLVHIKEVLSLLDN